MHARPRRTDLTPQEEILAAYLQEPRTLAQIARFLRLAKPTAKGVLGHLRKKRRLDVVFDYGATTYRLSHEGEE